jgi:hypothetical protein
MMAPKAYSDATDCTNTQRGDRLFVRFGRLFTPEIPRGKNNRDGVVGDQVMAAIGRCLNP